MPTQAETITATATQAAAAHGLTLVQAKLSGQNGRLTLQVLLEKADGQGNWVSPTLEECTAVSRLLGAQLDVLDVISGRYTLEVSSPGLERPLQSVEDYQRFSGQTAYVKLRTPHQPAKGAPLGAVKGQITAVTESTITIADVTGPAPITINQILYAHLAPTPEELAAYMKRHTTKS